MAESLAWESSAIDALRQPGRYGRPSGPAGIVVRERLGAATALITVRAGQHAALAAAVRSHFGISLPTVGKRAAGEKLTLAGIGPGQWLAEVPTTPPEGIESALRSALGEHATIVDQSHARVILRMAGPRVREVLAAGVPLDLHPRAFSPGDIAQTLVTHIGVQLWQLTADPIYELAVPRSMTGSFWNWLEHAAFRHGLKVRPALSTSKGETTQ
jgi:methylglutamate dehydrogenase subunit D